MLGPDEFNCQFPQFRTSFLADITSVNFVHLFPTPAHALALVVPEGWFNIKMPSYPIRIHSHCGTRWSYDCLISTTRFPILVRWNLYTGLGSRICFVSNFVSASMRFAEYRQVSNIRRTYVGNEIVDHSDVVGASPVGATPTTSSFST